MIILYVLVLSQISSGINGELTEIVKTTKGAVQGEILRTIDKKVKYSAFKGIPYAEPPLHEKRFKPPIEKRPWHGVLKTTVEGSICIQKDFLYGSISGSEDCLYLNVYTPHTKLSKPPRYLRAVMVYVYGGTFKQGYANSSLYGPDFLIEEDVVVVTFNYRLGPFGFLSLDHPGATGNAGLKDQTFVLRWVRENIIHFGGDPYNVALVGQSAGGAAVDLHSLSPISRGLFHRSISMSASIFCLWAFTTRNEAVSRAFKFGTILGIKTNNKDKLLKALYTIDASKMIEMADKLTVIDPAFKPTLENPKVAPHEEKFITECYLRQFRTRSYYQVPHMTGYTAHESVLFAAGAMKLYNLFNYSLAPVKPFVPEGPFFVDLKPKDIYHMPHQSFDAFMDDISELMFIAGIDYKQRVLSEHKAMPVYYYRLAFDAPESLHKNLFKIELKGCAHGDDWGYLFYVSVAKPDLNPKSRVTLTRRRIVRMWANFIKYGNPTLNGRMDPLLRIEWPNSGSPGLHLEINDKLTVEPRRITRGIRVYEEALNFAIPILSDCPNDETIVLPPLP